MTESCPSDGEWTTFEDARLRKFTMALALTPEERLAWLERAIEFAFQAGALPRSRHAPQSPASGRERADGSSSTSVTSDIPVSTPVRHAAGFTPFTPQDAVSDISSTTSLPASSSPTKG